MAGNHNLHVPAGKGCLAKLQGCLESLGGAGRAAALFILQNPEEAASLSIERLAKEAGTSTASIVRLGKSIGFSGFKEMQEALTLELAEPLWKISPEVNRNDPPEAVIDKVFAASLEVLEQSRRVLNPGEAQSAAAAMAAAGDIVIMGAGTSAPVAVDFSRKLTRIGLKARVETDGHFMAVASALLQPGDVAVAISRSGRSKEVVLALEIAQKQGAVTVCITTYGQSPLVKYAQFKLFAAPDPPRLGEAPFRTRLGQFLVTDVLYTILGLMDSGRSGRAASKSEAATRLLKEDEGR